MSQPSTAAEFDPAQDEFSIDNGDAGLLQVGREGATATEPASVYVMVNDQHEWTGSQEQAIEAAFALLLAAGATRTDLAKRRHLLPAD